jgi:hypothetical protein
MNLWNHGGPVDDWVGKDAANSTQHCMLEYFQPELSKLADQLPF